MKDKNAVALGRKGGLAANKNRDAAERSRIGGLRWIGHTKIVTVKKTHTELSAIRREAWARKRASADAIAALEAPEDVSVAPPESP